MCKSKMAIKASEPTPHSKRPSRAAVKSATTTATPRSSTTPSSLSTVVNSAAAGTKSIFQSSSSSNPSTGSALSNDNITTATEAGVSVVYSTTVSYNNKDSSSKTSQSSSIASLSSLRDSLPETPNVYNFSEICTATNNFLAKKFSSGTAASWRCKLRGKDVIVFQRKLRRVIAGSELKHKLSEIYRSHHVSIIKLLGASLSGDNHIYLVYQFVSSANLAACLRNPRNPTFTVLSTWLSRMQIAADLAHGMDYIHNNTGLSNTNLVHNHIKSSSIIVTEPSFNAKICHFGTAQLCGESEEHLFVEESSQGRTKTGLNRSNSRNMQFEGVMGYMSPEFQLTGIATQKSDVYAVGVVILELLTGEEPLKYNYDKERGEFRRTSIVETASEVMGGADGELISGEGSRVRRWVDKRLKDSFPVEVAERVTRIALECVHVDPDKRPNMRRVAGKISKLFLESERWSRKFRMPTEISVSLVPR